MKCPQNFMKTYIPTDIFFTVNVTRKISYFFASCLRKIAIKLSSSRRKSRGGRSQRGFAVSRFFFTLLFGLSRDQFRVFVQHKQHHTKRNKLSHNSASQLYPQLIRQFDDLKKNLILVTYYYLYYFSTFRSTC